MLFSQFLNYEAGNILLSYAQSTFLDGNNQILKQPIQNVASTRGCKANNCVNSKRGYLGKNVWSSSNVSENTKTSENVYTVTEVSYVNMFVPDLTSTLPYLFVMLIFGLRRLHCNKQ